MANNANISTQFKMHPGNWLFSELNMTRILWFNSVTKYSKTSNNMSSVMCINKDYQKFFDHRNRNSMIYKLHCPNHCSNQEQ